MAMKQKLWIDEEEDIMRQRWKHAVWGAEVFRKKPRQNKISTLRRRHAKNSWIILMAEHQDEDPRTPKAEATKLPFNSWSILHFSQGPFVGSSITGCSFGTRSLHALVIPLKLLQFSLFSLPFLLLLPLWPVLNHSASLTQIFFLQETFAALPSFF